MNNDKKCLGDAIIETNKYKMKYMYRVGRITRTTHKSLFGLMVCYASHPHGKKKESIPTRKQ